MDVHTIREQRARIAASSGEWTAHNIQLAPGLFTLGDHPVGDDAKIRRIVQVVSDLGGRPFPHLRVLDLACLEGLYSVEMALQGAAVVGIEGREASLAKARLAKEALGLARLDLQQGDVRRVTLETHGLFDVVLCLGILYHIEDPALFEWVMNLGRMTGRLLVIDTHIALEPRDTVSFAGRAYHGRRVVEHPAGSSPEEVRARLWASLDNPDSFYLTEASLLRLLIHAGFTSVYHCLAPTEPDKVNDRVTLAALKGPPPLVLTSPHPGHLPRDSFPESAARATRDLGERLRGLLRASGLGAARRWFQRARSAPGRTSRR